MYQAGTLGSTVELEADDSRSGYSALTDLIPLGWVVSGGVIVLVAEALGVEPLVRSVGAAPGGTIAGLLIGIYASGSVAALRARLPFVRNLGGSIVVALTGGMALLLLGLAFHVGPFGRPSVSQGSPAVLSRAQYASELHSIGTRLLADGASSGKFSSAPESYAALSTMRSDLTSSAIELEGLNPPADAVADNASLTTELRVLADAMDSLGQAARAKDRATAMSIVRTISSHANALDQLLKDLAAKGYR
jgi:hypothetical protein